MTTEPESPTDADSESPVRQRGLWAGFVVILAIVPIWLLLCWLLMVEADFLGLVIRNYGESMPQWLEYVLTVGMALLLPPALVAVSDRALPPGRRLLEAGRSVLLGFFCFSVLFFAVFILLRLFGKQMYLVLAPTLLAGLSPLLGFLALYLSYYWAARLLPLPRQNSEPPLPMRFFSVLGLGAAMATLFLLLIYGGQFASASPDAAWSVIDFAVQAFLLAVLVWLLVTRGQGAWRPGFFLLALGIIYSDLGIYLYWPWELTVALLTRDACLLLATICLYLPASRKWLRN